LESFLFHPPEGMNKLEFYLEQIGLNYFKDKWMTPRELKRDRDPFFISYFQAATKILKAKIQEGKFEENGLLVSHFRETVMPISKILKFWGHITDDFSLFGQYANGKDEGTVFLRLNPSLSLFDEKELKSSEDVVVLKNGGNPHVIKLLDYLYNEIVVHDTRGSTLKELANQVEEEVGRGTHPRRFIEDLISQIKII
jgi:hypothetical protein